MKTTAVIMAGGRGERFWPKSRLHCPKQFLSLTDDGKTMLALTAERIRPLVAYEDMFIVTNRDYAGLIKKQLPEIPEENILLEPSPKSTAPCIGFAAAVIGKKYQDAVMLVLPSDHLIQNDTRYLDTLQKAVDVAKENDHLVTIGITPTGPETGYGYIRFDPAETGAEQRGAYAVLRFVEKPGLDTAKAYLASGRYLWNSGMFAWKLSTILNRFQELLPGMYEGLRRIQTAWGGPASERVLAECFAAFASESIDYGIMEHADNIFTVPGDFGWDDAGSWLVMERMHTPDRHGNIAYGDIVSIGTRNSIIIGAEKLIAAVGLTDLIIVDTGDALLICNKAHAQNIKQVAEHLKTGNRNDLL